jgi:hypothetical protein
MPTALVGQREAIAAFHRRVLLRIEALVDLDPEFKVLLDDILDRDGWLDGDSARVRVFGQQQRRIALDHFVGKVGNELGHVIRILFCICICIVEIDTA